MNLPSLRLRRAWAPAVLFLAPGTVVAQGGAPVLDRNGRPEAPPANPATHPLLRPFQWRAIGPVGMGGRVDDIAVVESDPRVFYVGFATGGLWKTVNAGTTFEPVFDTHGTGSVGAVAVSRSDPRVVWVGTGEANGRQSSSFGTGVYRSADAGATFVHVGLSGTQSIGRIVVHPGDPAVAWVAAAGHLFGPNPERGVYRTRDAGQSWSLVLSVDEDTGAIDLALDPSDPRVLYAATYQRRRTAWGFNGGGPGSGIWKSANGGDDWTRLTGRGLPSGTMGRIGLDVARSNPQVVYALIEVASEGERVAAGDRGDREPDSTRSGLWRSTDGGESWDFRSNHNPRPLYYSTLRVDPTDEDVVYAAGSELSRSEDGGRTFEPVDGAEYVHVDHHAIWIDPAESDHLFIGNDGAFDVTWDRGRTWESSRTIPAGQFYQVSVDMRRPYHVCGGLQDNGSWCGPSAVRAAFLTGQEWYRVGGGDGFYSAIDPIDPAIVYSASQNGNMRRSDLRAGEPAGLASERVDALYLSGTSIQPRPPAEDDITGNVVPAPAAGEAYRWNWSTPFILSPHDPRALWAGANRLFGSRDRGDTWTMGPDLTERIDRERLEIMGVPGITRSCGESGGGRCILSKNDGVGAYGTITTVAESPVSAGVLWAGTDDGNVQVSRDANATWTDVTGNMARVSRGCWVSRVEASHVDAATAYVAIDCHRQDDLTPYLYVTRDFGGTWASLAGGLPPIGCVNVVKQDPVNPRLLYAGTEFGFFVSLDEGGSWHRLMTGLPTVRVDDVVVHPRDGDLVLGTHGRSVLVLDDVTPLQDLTPDLLAEETHLFQPRDAVLWRVDGQLARGASGAQHFFGSNPDPGTALHYYLAEPASGDVTLTVRTATGETFRRLEGAREAGLHRVQWDLRGDEAAPAADAPRSARRAPLATAGTYLVTLTIDGRERQMRTVVVLEDVWMNEWR